MNSFEILPGDQASNIIIHVPHGGTIIPEDVRRDIVLADDDLTREIKLMADSATDEIARDVYRRAQIKPWIFINNFSRLVIDPERFPDEREEMNTVGMGAVYTKTSDQKTLRLPDSHRDQLLISEYFAPYTAALSSLTTEVLTNHKKVHILDLHSYAVEALPYEIHQVSQRPALCIGIDSFHTSQTLIDNCRAAFASVSSIEIDQPFVGTYVPMEHYKEDARVKSLMLELRKDTYAYGDKKSPQYQDIVLACVDLLNRIEAA